MYRARDKVNKKEVVVMSRIRMLTSKISHICQEIRDIKSRRKPQTNISIRNYTSTGLVEGQTSQNNTRAPDNNSSAKEGSDDEDGLGDTCSLSGPLLPYNLN